MAIKKKMTTPTDTITARHMMRTNGIQSYNKISIVRAIGGVTIISIGLGTWLVPFTTAPLIMLGSWLLGYDSKIIIRRISFITKKIGLWLYANRSKKLIMRTIKTRIHQWKAQ